MESLAVACTRKLLSVSVLSIYKQMCVSLYVCRGKQMTSFWPLLHCRTACSLIFSDTELLTVDHRLQNNSTTEQAVVLTFSL